jgi:hypothetical protein
VKSRLAILLGLLAMIGCGRPATGRTGNTLVDACLHWTACTTPPTDLPPSASGDSLSNCMMGLTVGNRLPWTSGGVAVTSSQLSCLADAGLDCAKALACVSTPSPTPCPAPAWSCAGDRLARCDQFNGSRVVTEDCAAAGMHCIAVGGEARCALALCDASAAAATCMGTRLVYCEDVDGRDGDRIGAIDVFGDDCNAHDATCSGGSTAQCVGNGPSCTVTPGGGLSCDGDVLVSCDASGHQERTDCTARGLHCVALTPNHAGFAFACAAQPGGTDCEVGDAFGTCVGSRLQYCDDHGNEELDCKTLGYRSCADGRCVP